MTVLTEPDCNLLKVCYIVMKPNIAINKGK